MNYFKLNYSINSEIIGKTYPQSQNFNSVLDIHSPLFVWNNEVPLPENVYIPNLFLDQKAKFTDLISSSSIRYPLVSKKLYDCITSFNHNLIKFYQTKLILKSSEEEIFMISGKTKGFELLDLSRTEIDLLERFKFAERLTFAKVEDLYGTAKSVQYPNTITIRRYKFSNIASQDIFYIENINPSGGAYFVSNNLKEKIINEGCTGIEFEPIEVA